MASARPVPLIAVCFLALSNAAKECGNADRLTALSLSTSHLAMFSELSFYVPLMSLITQFPGSFSSPSQPGWSLHMKVLCSEPLQLDARDSH